MKTLFVPALMVALVGCSADVDPNASEEDLRGQKTEIDWRVSNNAAVVLLLSEAGEPVCQGTLVVRSDVVITSATCASRQPVAVFFGKVRRGNSLEGTVQVAETVSHPGWFKASEVEFGCALSEARDIALLRLGKPIAGANPVTISYALPRGYGEREGTVVVHQDLEGASEESRTMELRERTAFTNVGTNREDKTSFPFWGSLTPHHFGSAFLVEGKLVGIQACTLRVGKTNDRMAHSTQLPMVRNFIDATLSSWSSESSVHSR
jgi:hypothetical protein